MRDILVIIVARIGDTLLVTPSIHALKTTWPDARINVVAHPRQLDLLANNPDIHSLRGFTKKSAPLRGWLRCCGGVSHPMDMALVYGADKALFAYARRMAQGVIGFRTGDAELDRYMDKAVEPAPEPMRAVEDRALLLGALGVELGARRLRYTVTAEETAWARRWLAGQGVEGPVLGIQANSFASKAYRNMPSSMVNEVVAGLPGELADARVILFGGPGDQDNNAAIAALLGVRAVDISGQVSLRQAAALMSLLDFYIGIDTGPTHIAGALGVPMVALYHCLHPGRNLMPLDHPRCAIIEHPATDGDCDAGASISDIPAADVIDAVARVQVMARDQAMAREGAS